MGQIVRHACRIVVERRTVTARALVCLAFVAASFPVVGVTGAGAVDPTLVVTPSELLLDGQSVQVVGSAASGAFAVIECVAGATDISGCQIPNNALVAPDGSGSFTTAISVARNLFVATDHPVHCGAAPGTCVLAIVSRGFAVMASAPIAFDPAVADPDPQVALTPADHLLAGQAIAIEGSGFAPGHTLHVGQCVVGDQVCEGLAELPAVNVAADGTFATSRPASLRAFSGGFPRDCFILACEMRVYDYADQLYSVRVPLAFDPSQPLPPIPQISVSPAINLQHEQTVTVSGTGFDPLIAVVLNQCSGLDQELCNDPLASVNAGGDGTFVVMVPVRRLTATYDVTFGTLERVDCAEEDGRCRITASEHLYGGPPVRAFGYLNFDGTAALPELPAITATPSENLPASATILVQGTGLVPGDAVRTQRCVVEPSVGFCEDPDPEFGVVDATGGVSIPAFVRRIVGDGGQMFDCADPDVRCTLVVLSSRSFQRTQIPLTFDANSVIPTATATVTPSLGLTDLQSVAVHGANFLPGPGFLGECVPTPAGTPQQCSNFVAFYPGVFGHGTFDAPFVVRRLIGDATFPATDCAVAVGTCVVRVADNYGTFADVPIGFASSTANLPTLALRGLTVNEGTGGLTPAPVAIELSEPAPAPVVIHWKAVPGTATATDYAASAGTVTIPTGASSGTIPAEVVGDALDEPTERFTVEVDAVTGATVEAGSARVKIKDDDHQPRIRLGDFSVTEGDAGTTNGYIPVWLNSPSGRDIVIEYRTHHGSARSGTDFVRSHGEITIPAGWSGGFITIPIVGDRHHERTESFTVEIEDATNATIGDDTATETIFDND